MWPKYFLVDSGGCTLYQWRRLCQACRALCRLTQREHAAGMPGWQRPKSRALTSTVRSTAKSWHWRWCWIHLFVWMIGDLINETTQTNGWLWGQWGPDMIDTSFWSPFKDWQHIKRSCLGLTGLIVIQKFQNRLISLWLMIGIAIQRWSRWGWNGISVVSQRW